MVRAGLEAQATEKYSLPFQPACPTAYSAMLSPRSIVLIGMMGAGKSSVGRYLEHRTGLRRFDIDEIVSARFGRSISDVFATLGEDEFRRAETEALASLAPMPPAIIVT